jgi:hypothetical protein
VGEAVVAVDSVAGDSLVAELVVVVSDEAVGLGLASGAAVSVLFSQAASKTATTKIQMYFFMTCL